VGCARALAAVSQTLASQAPAVEEKPLVKQVRPAGLLYGCG
jgi:hypothetical protein